MISKRSTVLYLFSRPGTKSVRGRRLLLFAAMLFSVFAAAQEPAGPATLHGIVRDGKGNPIPDTIVVLKRKESAESITVLTDSQGRYSFLKLQDGTYTLNATKAAKDGDAAAYFDPLILNPHDSKTLNVTLQQLPPGTTSATSAPQFFDPPQFTVAGVTDTTSLGGHGSDTVTRTRDSLAKETVSLGESSATIQFDAAREQSLRDAVASAPADFDANHQLGKFLVASGRGSEAIPFLERAATANPPNYENEYDLALANAKAGNYLAAQERCRKILAIHDQAQVHHLLGDIAEKLDDSLEAVHQYQRAAELEPSEMHLFDWGAELLLHHAPEPALDVFSKGSRLFPTSQRMLVALGVAYYAHGDYDDAIRRIGRASDLNPNDPSPYLFLGRIEQAQTAPSRDVVEMLHRFVTLQPQNADANYYYGVGLWKSRKSTPDKAITAESEVLLKRAIELSPKYALAALQLGIIHSDQGAYIQAIADFQQALAAEPELEEAHYRLAQVYRQVGQPEKVRDELRRYTELTKQSAQQQDRERHEIKQFVYTLRDPAATQSQ